MILPNRRGASAPAAAACVFAAALAACAAAPAPKDLAAETAPLRVMVKLVHPSEDTAAIGAEATRVAGVPVTYAAATSASWHALALHCTSPAECDAAVARLRGAGATYQAVEIEGRKTRSAS
jgi:hypothetical protein